MDIPQTIKLTYQKIILLEIWRRSIFCTKDYLLYEKAGNSWIPLVFFEICTIDNWYLNLINSNASDRQKDIWFCGANLSKRHLDRFISFAIYSSIVKYTEIVFGLLCFGKYFESRFKISIIFSGLIHIYLALIRLIKYIAMPISI